MRATRHLPLVGRLAANRAAQATWSSHAVGGRSIVRIVRRHEPPRFELRDAGQVRGHFVLLGAPQIVTEDGTWHLTRRRRHLSYFAVAHRPGAEGADAAFYPHWAGGGIIAFEQQRYQLQHPLFTESRLRDEERRIVALVTGDYTRGLTIQLDRDARARPEIWLLLLFASWAILNEPAVG